MVDDAGDTTGATEATPDPGLSIDELARRAGTTTRNVRNYQTLGLVPPPRLEGRVGRYDEGHLARLNLIARLQDQGFSLAGIAELVKAWEQGRSLGDVLGFEQVLTESWSDEEPEEITLVELARLFPQAFYDLQLGLRAMGNGIVEPEGDHFKVRSPALLRAGSEMVAVGVPLEATLDEVALLRADLDRIAARFVQLFDRWVWQPFVQAGMPAERLPEVTDALRRMRPLAGVTMNALLAEAMERQTAAITAGQMTAASPPETKEATG